MGFKTNEIAEQCFNVGDEVYTMVGSKIDYLTIKEVIIEITNSVYYVNYILGNQKNTTSHDRVHDTVESLIEYIKEGLK